MITESVVWALRRLQATQGRWQLLCEAFGVKTTGMKELMETALRKSYYTHLLSFGEDGMVTSKDISSLDPGDEDEEVSSWGGLTGFGSRFAEVVRQAANGQVLQRENSFFRGLKFRLTGIGGKKL